MRPDFVTKRGKCGMKGNNDAGITVIISTAARESHPHPNAYHVRHPRPDGRPVDTSRRPIGRLRQIMSTSRCPLEEGGLERLARKSIKLPFRSQYVLNLSGETPQLHRFPFPKALTCSAQLLHPGSAVPCGQEFCKRRLGKKIEVTDIMFVFEFQSVRSSYRRDCRFEGRTVQRVGRWVNLTMRTTQR